MIGASGVGKTAFFLYPNLEYACASGMSFFASDTKGDLARNYGAIARDCYGYQVAVVDLRNPTRSDGYNLLTLINHYMDMCRREPTNLAARAKSEKYAKILSKTIINPDDLNAVEAALSLKDQLGCKVIAFTMGPPPAEGMLRELMAMGADEGILVSAREFGGSDTFATSQILAAAIKKYGVDADDVVFCGRQAIDGDTAQVGSQIAEKLNIPQVSYAADVKIEGTTVTVKRALEDGYMTIETQTPCLLTCIKELNEPRYMSIKGIMGCYDKPIAVYDYNTLKDDPLIDPTTIGLKGSPTNIFKSFTPPQKGAGMMLEGADKATCEKLAGILAAKHII